MNGLGIGKCRRSTVKVFGAARYFTQRLNREIDGDEHGNRGRDPDRKTTVSTPVLESMFFFLRGQRF